MEALILLFIVGSIIWVIFDSANRPELRRGEWIFGVIAIWVVFFPWYLFHRRGFPKAPPLVRVMPADAAAVQSASAGAFLPPATQEPRVQNLPPAGWLEDPDRPGMQRWWTGEEWAEHSRPTPGSPG